MILSECCSDRRSPNPGGGRLRTPELLATVLNARSFSGLPDGMSPQDISELVVRVGKAGGWAPHLVLHYQFLLSCTRAQDWLDGSRPVVWVSVEETANRLQITPSQVRRREKQLFNLGALSWNDSPNHWRYGVRDASGHIVEAYGVDLSPIVRVLPELAALADELDSGARERTLSRTAGHMPDPAFSNGGLAAEGVVAHSPEPESRRRELAGHAPVTAKACVGASCGKHPRSAGKHGGEAPGKHPCDSGKHEGEAPGKHPCDSGKHPEGTLYSTSKKNKNSSTCTGTVGIHPDQGNVAATVCEEPGIDAVWKEVRRRIQTTVKPTEWRGWLSHVAFKELDDGTLTLTLPSSYMRDWIRLHHHELLLDTWRETGPEISDLVLEVGPGNPDCEPDATEESRQDISGETDTAMDFSAAVLDLLPPGVPLPAGADWSQLAAAGAAMAGEMRISDHLWREACQDLGMRDAVAALAVIRRKYSDGVVRAPGAYFRELLRRGRVGTLNLAPTVYSLVAGSCSVSV